MRGLKVYFLIELKTNLKIFFLAEFPEALFVNFVFFNWRNLQLEYVDKKFQKKGFSKKEGKLKFSKKWPRFFKLRT